MALRPNCISFPVISRLALNFHTAFITAASRTGLPDTGSRLKRAKKKKKCKHSQTLRRSSAVFSGEIYSDSVYFNGNSDLIYILLFTVTKPYCIHHFWRRLGFSDTSARPPPFEECFDLVIHILCRTVCVWLTGADFMAMRSSHWWAVGT